jgi:hypothetical protein
MPTAVDIHIDGLHVGHKLALYYNHPDFDHKPNEANKWLWKKWNLMLDDFQRILDREKPDEVHLSSLGEAADVDVKKRNGGEFWTTDKGLATENSIRILEPLIELVDAAHFCVGTKSHVGDNFITTDDMVAANWAKSKTNPHGVTITPSNVKSAWNAVDYYLNGTLFNIQHKGKNRYKWSPGNGVSALGQEIVLQRYREVEKQFPDVVSRGHWHWIYVTPPDEDPVCVQVPSWQINPDYVYSLDPVGRMPVVGAVAFVIRDGELQPPIKLQYQFPRRKPWRSKKRTRKKK